MSTTAPVLVVDDGELDDIRAVLDELGAEFAHLRGGAVPTAIDPPSQLFIATPRRAMLAKMWLASALPVKIGVVTEDSNTLRGMLKRMGFDLLIRRPVHPYALRLVLLKALYTGRERRNGARFPIGSTLSFRSAMRRKQGVLADLSLRGARLLVPRPLKKGAGITLLLEKELTGGRPLSLRGRVTRVSDEPEESDKYVVGLVFDKLSKDQTTRLRQVLKLSADGPVQLTDAASIEASAESDTTPVAAAGAPDDRRKHSRAAFSREVVQLDDEASSVLLGRDISIGGMRVECDGDLSVGDQLRLAVYGGPREDPFILRGEVVRQESANSYGVKFDEMKPAVAGRLEALVARLPAVESLEGDEADALGSVVSRILEREAPGQKPPDEDAG